MSKMKDLAIDLANAQPKEKQIKPYVMLLKAIFKKHKRKSN